MTSSFLWGWFDALRRRDTEAMAAALDPGIAWQGIREDLVCNGPEEVVATYVSGYDATQQQRDRGEPTGHASASAISRVLAR